MVTSTMFPTLRDCTSPSVLYGNIGNAHGLSIDYGDGGSPVRFEGGTDPRGTGTAKGY